MKTRLWLNLALAVIVAVLIALVLLKPGAKKPAPPVALTTLPAAGVTNIKIARPHGPEVELQRTPDGWQMLAPVKIRADQYLVKSLLDDIHATVKDSFAAQPAKLAQYGLDPPQVTLWLNGTQFDFGGTEPLNNYRYVKTGDRIRLVSGLLFYRLTHGPYWWVSKRLLPENTAITALQLPNATLTRAGIGWKLAPADKSVSADTIQTLVDNWKNARAIGVAALDRHAPERGEVVIELKGAAEPLRFAILKDPNFLVLARPDLGLQYDLDSGQRAQLLVLNSSPPAPATAKSATLTTPESSASYKDSAHARTAGSGDRAPRH